jgi:hypothetical protein
MLERSAVVQKVKRPVAVTLAGGYLILQGLAAFGVNGLPDAWRYAAVVLFICTGIGFLKLYRGAWYSAVILFGAMVCWGLYLVFARPRQSDLSSPLAAMFVGAIFLVVLLLPAMRLPFFASEGAHRKTTFKDWLPTLVGALALLVAVAVGAHIATLKWTVPAANSEQWLDFSPADSSFSAKFPGQPTSTEQKVDLPIGPAEQRSYMVVDKTSAYGVFVTDYPDGYVNLVSADVLLDTAQKQALAAVGGQVTGVDQTASNGRILRSFSYSAPTMGTHGRADFYLAGDRLHKVIVAHEPAPGTSQDVLTAKSDTFLRSFRILKPKVRAGVRGR